MHAPHEYGAGVMGGWVRGVLFISIIKSTKTLKYDNIHLNFVLYIYNILIP